MGQFMRVQTEEEFDARLHARRAMLFIWVPWSVEAREAQAMIRIWVRNLPPSVNVYRVDPDEQPFVAPWLEEQHRKGSLQLGGYGEVVWLRAGKVIGEILHPVWSSQDELDRYSRCLLGHFCEPSPSLLASVQAWNDGCVVKLVTRMIQEEDFSCESMNVLADALEEAGVADQNILGHLRQPGAVHVRSCFLLDWLLGKP
jgi:hypothetical protein